MHMIEHATCCLSSLNDGKTVHMCHKSPQSEAYHGDESRLTSKSTYVSGRKVRRPRPRAASDPTASARCRCTCNPIHTIISLSWAKSNTTQLCILNSCWHRRQWSRLWSAAATQRCISTLCSSSNWTMLVGKHACASARLVASCASFSLHTPLEPVGDWKPAGAEQPVLCSVP